MYRLNVISVSILLSNVGAVVANAAILAAPLQDKTVVPSIEGEAGERGSNSALAELYLEQRCPFSPNETVLELQKRAVEGDERAITELAVRYYYGEGVPIDYEIASSYCRQRDHPVSKFILSLMFKYGMGALRNKEEAVRLKGEALVEMEGLAQVGDGLAYYCMAQGCLVAKQQDKETAKAYFQKAIDFGCLLGMQGLGSILIKEKELDQIRSGFLLLQTASLNGSAHASRNLAAFFISRKNEAHGIHYLKQAAALQEPSAMVELGLIYGNQNDFKTAVKLFQGAISKWNDYPEAQALLAFCYYNGFGLRQDYQRAFYFAERAARSGDGDGCILLATLYRRGLGVPMDYSAAYVWVLIGIARDTIYGDAVQFREGLEKVLSPQQIATAQQEAARLQKEINDQQNEAP